MGAKWKTKINNIPYVSATTKALQGRKVQVGASSNDAWLASIHEYGCTIPVTEKMRAYLHGQGLHLKPTTTHIRIPERSFLRAGHDENADRVLKQTERALGQVLAGKMSIDDMLDLYGQQMATAIKKYMRDLKTPELHPYTIAHKGSSNPLVDTGQLVESIVWRTTGI